MKTSKNISLAIVGILVLLSCKNTTENYASKENGMRFDAWELNYYEDDDYDVYWPSLKLAEPVEGDAVIVKSDYNWWSGNLISRDTANTCAILRAFIRNYKSSQDEKFYNSVRLKVTLSDNRYWADMEHRFIFNEGRSDSLSFVAKANDNNYFIPGRNDAEKIIRMLCGSNPIDINVRFNNKYIDGSYSFTTQGSPKLKRALELNHKRMVLAEKEYDKADAKSEREFQSLFD